MAEEVTIYKAWFSWKAQGELVVEATQAIAWGDSKYKIITPPHPSMAFNCQTIHYRDSVSLSRVAAIESLRAQTMEEGTDALRGRLAEAEDRLAVINSWSPG